MTTRFARSPRLRWAAFGGAAGVALWAGSEWLDQRWSSQGLPKNWAARDRGASSSQAVVVLGFINSGERANFINRWRVRIALRSMDPTATMTLICSGGQTTAGSSEATLLEREARRQGFSGPILLEQRSGSTWQNTENIAQMLESFDRVVIASQPAHALKARRYLAYQRPDLAAKLEPADDHRLGEAWWFKPVLAGYGLVSLRGATTRLKQEMRDARPR